MKITNIKQLRHHIERLDMKRQVNREKLGTELKLLRYEFVEDLVKSVGKLF